MNESPAKIRFGRCDSLFVLKINDDLRFNQCAPLEHFLKTVMQKKFDHNLIVDLSDTQLMDSTALGLLAQIALQFERMNHQKPGLYCPDNDLKKVLLSMSLEKLFNFVSHVPNETSLPELTIKSDSHQNQTDRVLSAHKTLMGLSDKNKQEFKSVVDMLQDSMAKFDK